MINNTIKQARIVIEREKNSYDITKFYIVSSSSVWQSYDPTTSLLDVITHIYAYYFLLPIPYPECFEVILGFIHEALEIKFPVSLTKKKSIKYVNTLRELLVNVAKVNANIEKLN